MKNPKVSIIMSAYNHEKYVAYTIKSILEQTFSDFEFLIIDDFSTDTTAKIIESFKDNRIIFLKNEKNIGASSSANKLFPMMRGKYVTFLNSDDIWVHDKLQKQITFLENNAEYGACFSKCDFINEKTQYIYNLKNTEFGCNPFIYENYSQGKILRIFFERGNYLCCPSVMMRKTAFDSVGYFNYGHRQLEDYCFWIKLVKNSKIHILNESLVWFRLIGNNVSTPTQQNMIRVRNEHYLIRNNFFDDISREILIDGFGDLLKAKDLPTPEIVEIEKCLLYLHPSPYQKINYLIGIRRLYDMLNTPNYRHILENFYGINTRWFQDVTGSLSIF